LAGGIEDAVVAAVGLAAALAEDLDRGGINRVIRQRGVNLDRGAGRPAVEVPGIGRGHRARQQEEAKEDEGSARGHGAILVLSARAGAGAGPTSAASVGRFRRNRLILPTSATSAYNWPGTAVTCLTSRAPCSSSSRAPRSRAGRRRQRTGVSPCAAAPADD